MNAPSIALAFAAVTIAATAGTTAAPPHDRQFWRQIVSSDYAVPPRESAVDLIRELNGYLASPDPELRDEFAYAITTAWIFQKRIVPKEALLAFETEWRTNLTKRVGERNTNSVLTRSFSALDLSVLAALDNASPFLTEDQFHRLLNSAISYLGAERDLRGHDRRMGWLHATAHTADLLKFLCRSSHLRPDEQNAVLRALIGRIASADVVFTHGETDRLARVVLSLYGRTDFDRMAFRAWLAKLDAPPIVANVTDEALTQRENTKNFLAGLYSLTAAAADENGSGADVQRNVLTALRRFM